MSKIDDAISAIMRAKDIESVIGSIKSIDRKKTTIDELVINYGWTRIDDSTAILSKYGKDWFMIKPSSTPDIAVITAPSGEGRVRAKVSIYKNIYDEAKKTSEYFNKLIDGDINRNTRIDNLDDKTYEIPEYTEEEITELAQGLFNPFHIPPYEWDVDKRREQDIPYIEKAIADARAAVKSKTIQDHIKLQTFLNLGISAVSYKQEKYATDKRSEVLNYAPPKMIKLMGKNPNLADPQFWIDQANLAVRDRMSIEEIVNYKMPNSLIDEQNTAVVVDRTHLNAILSRLSNEKSRLSLATNDSERQLRAVFVAQMEKELADERKYLGEKYPGWSDVNELPEIDDDELLRQLQANDDGKSIAEQKAELARMEGKGAATEPAAAQNEGGATSIRQLSAEDRETFRILRGTRNAAQFFHLPKAQAALEKLDVKLADIDAQKKEWESSVKFARGNNLDGEVKRATEALNQLSVMSGEVYRKRIKAFEKVEHWKKLAENTSAKLEKMVKGSGNPFFDVASQSEITDPAARAQKAKDLAADGKAYQSEINAKTAEGKSKPESKNYPPVVVQKDVAEQIQAKNKPAGRENIVKTAKGSKIATAFHVVEASDLIVSHDENGNENPLYPQELQPRDRSRDSSIAWVEKTSKTLDPDSLGKTSRADTGAPIIGPDGVVESGNGRSMAIKQAYKNGMADEYRDWLIEEAEYFGLDSGKIKSMRAPVLVRVRTQEVDRAAFAVEANQDDKLSLTATEKARSDAKRLTPDLMALFEPSESGDLLAPSNQRFIRGFLQSLGNTEAAQYSTSDGKPTASLIDRIQSAVFAKAYKDERLLELMADSAKPEIKNVIVALNAAAPEFIRAREFSEAGIEVSLDDQAIAAVIEATNIIRSAKNTGQSVDEFVSQAGLFGDIPPEVAAVAVFISENNRSAKRLGAAFKAMAKFVRIELEKGSTVDMFGDPVASMKDVIEAANRELESEFGQGGSISLFESLNGYGDGVFDIFA